MLDWSWFTLVQFHDIHEEYSDMWANLLSWSYTLAKFEVSILLSRDKTEQVLRYKLSIAKGEVTNIIDAATAFSTIIWSLGLSNRVTNSFELDCKTVIYLVGSNTSKIPIRGINSKYRYGKTINSGCYINTTHIKYITMFYYLTLIWRELGNLTESQMNMLHHWYLFYRIKHLKSLGFVLKYLQLMARTGSM